MNCTYYRPTSHNLREWENIRDKMRYDLSLLEKEPVDAVSLRCYLESLLPQAEQLEGVPGMRFFALGDPNSMPADCRDVHCRCFLYKSASSLPGCAFHDRGGHGPDQRRRCAPHPVGLYARMHRTGLFRPRL